MKKTVEFLGLPFDNLTVEEALDKIEDFIHEGVPRKVFTPNVLLLMWSWRDDVLRVSPVICQGSTLPPSMSSDREMAHKCQK